MSQSDRQTDKDRETKWSLTVQEGQWHLLDVMPDIVAEWGWQEEIAPTTGSKHRQCYVRTKRQVRFAQMNKTFPGVHIEMAREWAKLVNYCKKTETAIPNTQVHQLTTSTPMTMAQAMMLLASYIPYQQPIDENTNIKEIESRIEHEFWESVKVMLRENPNTVALWTQPQYMRAWKHTRTVWIDFALENIQTQTDRQTDDFLNYYAFEN